VRRQWSAPEAENLLSGVVVEGAADSFFARPFDENPYSHTTAPDEWGSWRHGWLEASWFNEIRGDQERRRWAAAA
jgi:hypothetical protein